MSILGKLSINAFPHDVITLGGAIMMIVAILIGIFYVTYTKRWHWLWSEWITTTDHKKIGVMYIFVSIVMGLRGFADVLLMRVQQATSVGSSHGILSANHFQQIFSAHGVIMIFFVAMGFLFGIINLVLPLQIGSRDVAFPFLNATSFWLFSAGMVLMNASLIIGNFTYAGWLSYPPLSELKYSPGVGVDYWIWSLQVAGLGSLLSGINFLVTIIKLRCKGMTLMRMPLFTWSVFGTMVLVILAFPILTVTLALLYLDRTVGTHFFTASGGGNMMMYVNLIWSWGHPEVYILVLPSFGIFSEVVSVFSRKRLFGYRSMVWAIWAIVVLSFIVWLHHFFTMGAGSNVNAFFGMMTMIIAVPTGVKIFNWLFTMFGGRIKFNASMIYFLGFIFLFTLGGVAGVMMAVPAIDYQLHNSLFLVAHFHTMIVSGVLFGDFIGIMYWFPKIFGFKLIDFYGRVAAYLWIIGFIVAFGPLYILGFMGATRRLDHYPAYTGWQSLFIVAGIGVGIIAIALVFQFLQLIISYIKKNENIDTTGDPWDGRTLEWSTSSPPPHFNYAILPEVESRDAFWEEKQRTDKNVQDKKYEDIPVVKNTPLAMYIGAMACIFGFCAVWHIWWLLALSLLTIIVLIMIRTTDEETEYIIPASEVAEIDKKVQWKV